MVMVEGAYYPPCMPDDLIKATERLREGEITPEEHAAFIRGRREFRMRNKEAAKPGVSERLQCPAAGANPIAICALKPRSQEDRPITQIDGLKIDLRRTIDHTKVMTNGAMPKVCSSQTVTVSPNDGAKFRQELQYGSPEQMSRYTLLRQSQEGIHGTAKDEAGVALASPGRRRAPAGQHNSCSPLSYLPKPLFSASPRSLATQGRTRTATSTSHGHKPRPESTACLPEVGSSTTLRQ